MTTKNMVHAFCGVVISFIDKNWVLHEYVLDLIPLDGDHSGEAVGRLVFKRLKKAKMAGRISKHGVVRCTFASLDFFSSG